MHAEKWRAALDALTGDARRRQRRRPARDVGGARGVGAVTWVGTGQRWRLDAASCPQCGARIRWDDPQPGDGWACSACDLRRPRPDLWLDGDTLVLADGRRLAVRLTPPGVGQPRERGDGGGGRDGGRCRTRTRRCAPWPTSPTSPGATRSCAVDGVQRPAACSPRTPRGGRRRSTCCAPRRCRSSSASTRASRTGATRRGCGTCRSNACRGRFVVATGERGRDLAVRLHYAEVEHEFVPRRARRDPPRRGRCGHRGRRGRQLLVVPAGSRKAVANYSSFQDFRKAVAGARLSRSPSCCSTPSCSAPTATAATRSSSPSDCAGAGDRAEIVEVTAASRCPSRASST